MSTVNKPFRIGIWLVDEGSPENGGFHSYIKAVMNALRAARFGSGIELVVLGYELKDTDKTFPQLRLKPMYRKPWLRLLNSIAARIPGVGPEMARKIRLKHEAQGIRELQKNGISVVYQPSPGVEFTDFPFITTHWDTGHLSSYAFPELTMHGQFESRDSYHTRLFPKALLICCESEAGKAETAKFLRINPDRIEVVGLFPGEVVRKELPAEPVALLGGRHFFVYPSTYTAHKNHANLLAAFAQFSLTNPDVTLVFTGKPLATGSHVDACIAALGLTGRVLQLGTVSPGALKWLYEHAVALVMPTFLGPTNMPPLEARALGCRVICTDLPGHREQLDDDGWFIDPLSPDDIANALAACYLDFKTGVPGRRSTTDFDSRLIGDMERVFRKAYALRRTWDF